nr:zinc knuckle CX2CX4HX4C [Tanacetum cinerariifolium]
MEAVDNTIKPTLAGLASRIRNIDGKPLRYAIRNIKPSTANDGNSSHVEADATKVVRSPNRVSFDDNIRISQINPNDINVASELNEENVRATSHASPRFPFYENPKSATTVETFWESTPLTGINTNVSQCFGASTPLPPVNNNGKQPGSFATVVQQMTPKKVVKVKEMRNAEIVEGAAVAIPLEEVEAVTSRFANTLYGYFIEIPSGESKVRIEVQSMLWGNRLRGLVDKDSETGKSLLALSVRTPDVSIFEKVKEIPEVEIRLLARKLEAEAMDYEQVEAEAMDYEPVEAEAMD